MIIGFTGHRSVIHTEQDISNKLIRILRKLKPEKTVSGMALGFDQIAARVSVYLKIPFIAAIPFKHQAEKWSKKQQEAYHKILEQAQEIVYVDELKGYSKPGDIFIHKFFRRNYWIVQHSDQILAYYINGRDGGTAHTMYTARAYKKPVRVLKFEDQNGCSLFEMGRR
jgi:uncharacterized phage-like protein YoqJ